MRRDTELFSELTHKIYGAALHPEQWTEVVAAIAASMNSKQGLLCTPYIGADQGGLYFTLGIEETYVQLYATGYIGLNVWNHALDRRGAWRDGEVYTGDEMVPRDEFLASPFYQEFLKPQGTAQACMSVVFSGGADLPVTVLNLFRNWHEPAFDERDKAWLRMLVSHVSRSLGLMFRLDRARLENAALLASLDRLHCGAALLDAEMRVLHLNLPAKQLLDRREGLSLDALGRLAGNALDAQTGSADIAGWLEQVRRTPPSEQPHFLQGASFKRHNTPAGVERRQIAGEAKHYDLQCVTLPDVENLFAHRRDARYVVFITSPQAVRLPSIERLGELYALTPAQAKVACEFATGAGYKQVAERLEISEDTVRAHIREIYPKTRVNRQSDLVRLILSVSQSGV